MIFPTINRLWKRHNSFFCFLHCRQLAQGQVNNSSKNTGQTKNFYSVADNEKEVRLTIEKQ